MPSWHYYVEFLSDSSTAATLGSPRKGWKRGFPEIHPLSQGWVWEGVPPPPHFSNPTHLCKEGMTVSLVQPDQVIPVWPPVAWAQKQVGCCSWPWEVGSKPTNTAKKWNFTGQTALAGLRVKSSVISVLSPWGESNQGSGKGGGVLRESLLRSASWSARL